MRFLLYFVTLMFISQTFGYIGTQEWDMVWTGVFLSSIMVFWSYKVWTKRRTKSGKTNAPKGANKLSTVQGAWETAASELRTTLQDATKDLKTTLKSASDEVKSAWQNSSSSNEIDQAPLDPNHATNGDEETEVSDATSEESQLEGNKLETSEAVPAPVRQLWNDNQGNSLSVGAQVSFPLNSNGSPVLITGLLLGEKEGKARIEVTGGGPLPKGDYSIDWSLVTLTSS